MSDTINLIVTLSKGQYENLKNIQCGSIGVRMIVNAVMNGIPLDGMTNGEVIQALFPNLNIVGTTDKKEFFALDLPKVKEWWSAPYQKGGEE
jgi:hypothetical protein